MVSSIASGHVSSTAASLICFIIELILSVILVFISIFATYRLIYTQKLYHINLKITVINVYCTLPIMAVMRSLVIIQELSGDTFLTPNERYVVARFLLLAVLSMWYMQLPSMIERACATAFYKNYQHWKCWGTLLLTFCCWIWVVIVVLGFIEIQRTVTVIMLAVGNICNISLYVTLFNINLHRYRNGRVKQSLKERYQTFENMQSMYPLFWTIGIEVCYNIYSVGMLGTLYFLGIKNNYDGVSVLESIIGIIREAVLIVYCFPFLIYSEKRRHANFINKVNSESQNEHNLYFKQLKAQW